MSAAGWSLDARLAADTTAIGDLPLCRLLLSNDANYPWTILVPRRLGVREIVELGEADQQQLQRESNRLARALIALFAPTKLNIAALGNVVPQLHIHHIARFDTDAAWPAPVWGKVPALDYPADARDSRIAALRDCLAPELQPV